MSIMRIFLTNLGKYVEGSLIGEWVNLPINEDELKQVFKRIKIDERYEESFITDYEVEVCGVGNAIGEYSSMSLLNEVAEKLDNLCDWEKEKLQAILEAESCSCLTDLLETIENLDNWDLLSDVKDREDLGYYYAEECCCINIPNDIKNYFNYEAFGRDIELEGNGIFTDYGYLINNR